MDPIVAVPSLFSSSLFLPFPAFSLSSFLSAFSLVFSPFSLTVLSANVMFPIILNFSSCNLDLLVSYPLSGGREKKVVIRQNALHSAVKTVI